MMTTDKQKIIKIYSQMNDNNGHKHSIGMTCQTETDEEKDPTMIHCIQDDNDKPDMSILA